MKNIIKQTSLLFLILLILYNCNEEETYQRGYPSLYTLEINNSTENGAVFVAEILNYENLNILEYGFLWSENVGIEVNRSEKKIITTNFSNGVFSSKIESALKNGSEYFVRAYLITEDFTVYGNMLSFNSKGSLGPTIRSMQPNSGVYGDTIQIKGKNFSYLNASNKVFFKNLETKVVKSNDTIITCLVPNVENENKVDVTIEVLDKVAPTSINFNYNTPIINSISPLTGTFGDELTIKGSNFGIQPLNNIVKFGNVDAKITYSDKNTIKVLVPNGLENSSETIRIKKFNGFVDFNSIFKLNNPSIKNAKLNLNSGEELTFSASNFNPEKDRNKVFFEGVSAEIISVTENDITVMVPRGPYPNKNISLELEVLDLKATYTNPIEIEDIWRLVSDDVPFYSHSQNDFVVNANGQVYTLALQNCFNCLDYYLWTFNEIDKTWIKSAVPNSINTRFGANATYGIFRIISDGKDIYVYLWSNNNFLKYDTTTKQWTSKNNFFTTPRHNISSFSINGKIYMGLGFDQHNFHNDLHVYDPDLNSWKQVASLPSDGLHKTSTFVLNGIGYVVGGSQNGSKACWSYNPLTDSWSQIADFPHDISETASFVLNNSGYITGGKINKSERTQEVWRYNPNTNAWLMAQELAYDKRSEHFAFELNGKAFVGGGTISLSLFSQIASNDLYEYNPK